MAAASSSTTATPAANNAKQWRTEQCVALCDYTAQDATEISFRKGDVISVTGKRGDSSGFWEGITTGANLDVYTGKKNKDVAKEQKHQQKIAGGGVTATRGLFPTCMVTSNLRAFHEPRFCDKVLALYDYTARAPEEMDLEKFDVITMTRPSSSTGWWYGIKEGASSRVTERGMTGPLSPAALAGLKRQEKLVPLNFVTAKLVVGGLTCQGNTTNEIPFTGGDVIQVIRRWNDGWWEGTLRGQRGIFPSNLTHPNIPTASPPLFCAKCKTILQYSGYASVGATGKCSECASNEMVVEQMLQALVSSSRSGDGAAATKGGTSSRVDLFAGIDMDTLYGKKFAAELRPGVVHVSELIAPLAAGNLETTTVRKFHA